DSMVVSKQYLMATGGQDTFLHLWVVNMGSAQAMGLMHQAGEKASITLHHTLHGHKAPVMAVRFSSNGLMLASASGDKTVRLWDPIKMELLGILEGPLRYVTSCAFSDDGALLAAGSGDRFVHVWRVDNITVNNTAYYSSKTIAAKFPSQRYRENKKV
ncbi:unnamed protein product, partial [Meganyctiphanes norvegica]